jgi:glutamine---fructose-6-phosphate transaminase (isomerizing)
MCGIFGIAFNESSGLAAGQVREILKDLFLFSESRGKEASGLAAIHPQRIEVLKSHQPASALLRGQEYGRLLKQSLGSAAGGGLEPVAFIGHARLVTTGNQFEPLNNQPVVAGQAVGVHNGIIVNHEEIWQDHPRLERRSQVDSEVILACLRHYLGQGLSLTQAVSSTFGLIVGTASIAVAFEDLNVLLLATNNGSLYRYAPAPEKPFIFASEGYILSRLARRRHLRQTLGNSPIQQIRPGQGCLVDLNTMQTEDFGFSPQADPCPLVAKIPTPRVIVEIAAPTGNRRSLRATQKQVGLGGLLDSRSRRYLEGIKAKFPHDSSWQDTLVRCSKCVLPETMPFIKFDQDGVCNYCHHHRKLEFKGAEALEKAIQPHRRPDGGAECVVGLSGGRDSLFSLHYVKKVLGLNPIAYTYDWGMVTDLARRNISRVCAKLGVENILVSADITQKRRFIKKNVAAWLKRPELGMVPLFMAGDKQYFFYLQKIRRQVGAGLSILGENMLERTDFKTGFAGVPPHREDAKHVYTLPTNSKLKLMSYYTRAYFKNPGYLNASLLDSLFAYGCYYLLDRSYLNLYGYIPWLEQEVVPTLINEYDFELATDTGSTWRIGDGTASFYNYIYYTMAGFTENDTFRSNQIREGLINREEALSKVRQENRPRFETMFWYLDIIGLELEMEEVLRMIQAAPKVAKRS